MNSHYTQVNLQLTGPTCYEDKSWWLSLPKVDLTLIEHDLNQRSTAGQKMSLNPDRNKVQSLTGRRRGNE